MYCPEPQSIGLQTSFTPLFLKPHCTSSVGISQTRLRDSLLYFVPAWLLEQRASKMTTANRKPRYIICTLLVILIQNCKHPSNSLNFRPIKLKLFFVAFTTRTFFFIFYQVFPNFDFFITKEPFLEKSFFKMSKILQKQSNYMVLSPQNPRGTSLTYL